MLRNYFITAWRNLVKNKLYSVINIIGLTIGLAVGILILIWVQDEFSFDGFHKKEGNISIGWQVFLLSGCIAILIAVITISFQSIKASLANPVQSIANGVKCHCDCKRREAGSKRSE